MSNNLWDNYTEKSAALADKDEIMLRDSTDGKNRKSPLSKIWDYVVEKMATAVVSKLETDNKTIVGAINYLYGKTSKITFTNTKLNVQAWGSNAIGFIFTSGYGNFQIVINPESSSLNVYKLN